jgi:tRNA nucleotidyltransferase (CCA-adding enzyme)
MQGDRMDRILQEIMKEVTPSDKEKQQTSTVLDKVRSATDDVIKPFGFSHMVAGSFIRDTWMPDKKEFDIFILFPTSKSRENLEKEGLEIGKNIVRKLRGKHKIAFAEHPYVRASIDGYDVDIVPCYKVDSALKIKSAVDRTPFHSKWLSKHLFPKFVPEVRLFKRFCKGQGLYGSDTKTLGFSGYLCELMIINYRNFRSLIGAAANWEPGKVLINLEGFAGFDDADYLHKKFPKQPLIVIDPVDPSRNVAAAVSPENFMRFVFACKELINKPSSEFFFQKPFKPDPKKLESEIMGRNSKFIGFSFDAPDVIPDILWPQLRKTGKRVSDILEQHDFNVTGWDVWTNDMDKCIIFFELETPTLPKYRKLIGPSIFSKKHTGEFIAKYKDKGRIWIEGEFWVAEIRRQFQEVRPKIKEILTTDETTLKAKGVASYLSKEITKGFSIMQERELISHARRYKDFGRLLTDFFEKRVV